MTDETAPIIYVVDDDPDVGGAIARLLRREGYSSEPFRDPQQLLQAYEKSPASCVVTDVMMDGLNGFGFARQLRTQDPAVAIIFMTAWPKTADAVEAIRHFGGLDYIDKPLDPSRLLASVAEGVEWSKRRRHKYERLARLTRRERQVFDLLVRGLSTKAIATELGLSPKTVEDYRAQIAKKTGTTGLAQLIALASHE